MDTTKAIWLFWFPWFVTCHGKEDPKSACDSSPCQNNAQCIDVTYPGGPLAFKCACKEGFEGLTCQKRMDLCADDPCQNGGVCSQRGEHYHCACPEGYHGKNCENSASKKDPCGEKPCGVHGVCEVVNSQIACECIQGFSGTKCETSEAEKVVAVPSNELEEDESWVIKDILIAMLFFVVLFAAILFFVCCHCYRVWNQRSALKAVQEAKKAAGKDPGPVTGWVDLSNQMCYDFFCCCYPRGQEKSGPLGDRCFADPDNITGVIVPLKDYNTLIRNGYMPLCYRDGTEKVKIDPMVPEVTLRSQPNQMHYNAEPVKYVTNGSMISREEAKNPAVCNFDRCPQFIQSIPHCKDVMDPLSEQSCVIQERYPDGRHNMGQQTSISQSYPDGRHNMGQQTSMSQSYPDGRQNMGQQTSMAQSYPDGRHNMGQQTSMEDMPEPMAPEAIGAQRQNYYSNTGIKREPSYYNYKQPNLPDQSASNASLEKKISRSKLYAQHGKSFIPSNVWNQSKFLDSSGDGSHTFPQSTNQNHIQTEHNQDTYPAAMYNSVQHEPARQDFYSNGLYPLPPTTPYPWIPQPYGYPYAFPYPPQNNILDHSSSAVCTSQPTPREKVRKPDRNLSPRSTVQQKLPNGAVKGHALGRKPSVGNVICGESKMDNLQFTDDDAGESESMLIDLSEDDGRYTVDTDTDDEAFDRIDDDGYGSTNRLSESEAGGRVRPSQNHREYSDRTPRYYNLKKQKQKIQKYNKLHSQYSMQNSKPRRSKLSEQESCKIPLCSSEHAESSVYRGSEESTSEDEQEQYSTFSGSSAVHNNGSRTMEADSYRAQLQNGGQGPNKLMRRGDLWNVEISKCLTPQKYLSKGEDIQPLKPIAPKKVKGILKNSSHGVNYNRSANSFNVRKIKDIAMGKLGSRRRSLRHRDHDETE